MAGEIVASSKSSQSSNPFGSISILVVDDDTTCLSIVAAILKSWKYEVVTVKHPMDALCTLRIKGGSFDLVVTDVHMPDMDGFELQKQIDAEFKLPVVFMSADDKDGIILKGLQSGAAFFIVKPIAPDDLKNLWQYAVAKKKGKTIIEEIGRVEEISQADIDCNEDTLVKETSQTDKASNEDLESASSANEDRQSTKEFKRKAPANDTIADKGENKDDSATPKKAKVIWTNALHNQFLEAIRSIGLERAVPKKILELMNVPGLTRENVASHLQKYRIFLKRVSEASYKIQSAAERNMVERNFRSTFASGGQPSSLMYNNNNRYRLGLRNEGHVPVVEAPSSNLGNPCSFSSTNSTPRFGGSAQSRLLCNQGNLKQPTIGNGSTKPLYQANPSALKLMEPNNHRTRSLSLHGNASGGLMSGANLFQMYQQKAQEVAPKSFNTNGLLKYNYSTTSTCGVRSPKDISNTGYGKMGAFNSSNLNLKPNSYNNNYAGYRVAGDGRLVGLGYIGFMGAEAPTDFNNNNFLINGQQNGRMPVLSGNSGDHLAQQGVITSTGFGFHSENHISPTFINAIPIQQENTSVPSLPPTPPLQQNGFGNGGESEDDIFGLFNNVSDSASDSFLQPYDEGDLSFTFLNQINIQSPTQQDREQAMSSGYSFNSYLVEDNQLVNKQTLGEQPGGEVMVSNFGIDGSQSKKYFPSFDQSPSQQDDEEFLESVFGSGEYDWDNNIGGL